MLCAACAADPCSEELIRRLENRIAQADKEIAILQKCITDSLALIEIHENKIRAYAPLSSGNNGDIVLSRRLETAPIVNKKAFTPETEYQTALKVFYSKRYATSRKRFAEFLNRYPDHPLSDNALYWTGESWYSERQYSKAAAVFETLVNQYPAGNKAPHALLKIGYAHYSMNDDSSAKAYLKRAASFGGKTEEKANRLIRRIDLRAKQPAAE